MINTEAMALGTTDLIVFAILLAVSLSIGLFHAFRDRNNTNTDNYYFGGRRMSYIPVGLSISVTFISAITVIGFPTEAYGYGSILTWYAFPAAAGNFIACVYYIPLVHKLRLDSIYKYLEMRFNRKMRLLASSISIFSLIFYYSVAIYIPSLALSAVTPIGLKWTIFLTSIVCIVYTTLGGMKAVVWTDTIQYFVMFAGALMAFVKSTIDVGGFGRVWEALERGNRQTATNFRFDPTFPYTIWAIVIGQTVSFCRITCINQASTQRYLSCKSVRESQIAVFISTIPTCGFYLLATLTGCVMYAYFEGCDPVKAGLVDKPDQLMPYMVMLVFQNYPGLAGLFVSAAFSGAMSTVSSGINSCGSLIMEDFILPNIPRTTEVSQIKISKITVLTYGILVMGFTFSMEYIDTTVFQLGFVVFGCLGGPIFAVFTLGIYFPWCTTLGAFIGQAVSTIFMAWVALSASFYGRPPEKYSFIPTSTDMCSFSNYNQTFYENKTEYELTTKVSTLSTQAEERTFLQETLFAVTFLYYSLIATVVAIVVAMVVSFITAPNKAEEMNPRLFVPLVSNKHFPLSLRKFFRFGVPEESADIKIIANELEDLFAVNAISHRNAHFQSEINSPCQL